MREVLFIFGSSIRSGLTRNLSSLRQSLPVIFYFLVVFYSILFWFDEQYIIVAPAFVVMFKINYKKRFSFSQLAKLCLVQVVLSYCAFAATQSLFLTVLLNFLVPFLLIYTKTSQVNPLGYYLHFMMFTFCQFIQGSTHTLGYQTQVILSEMLLFFVATGGYQLLAPHLSDQQIEHRSFLLIARFLEEDVEKKDTQNTLAQLADLMQGYYKKAYLTRGGKKTISLEGRLHYNFALLVQRVLYFSEDTARLDFSNETSKALALDVAAYVKKIGQLELHVAAQEPQLFATGEELLEKLKGEDDLPAVFLETLLTRLLFIFRLVKEGPSEAVPNTWIVPKYQRLAGRIKGNLTLHSFELRVALRMSLTMTISFAIMAFVGMPKAIWLPMNTFLLLRPMSEEISYRIRTRFLGTIIGCFLSTLLLLAIDNLLLHLIFGSLLGIFVYVLRPGTTLQAVISTIFGLLLTTIALPDILAVELRFVFVVVAILLVYFLNFFFFTTDEKRQFQHNFQQLLHIQHLYVQLFGTSLEEKIDYGYVADVQIQYHLVHSHLQEYIGKNGSEDSKFYQDFLATSWTMMALMERIVLLVNTRYSGAISAAELKNYAAHVTYVLDLTQQLLQQKSGRVVAPKLPFYREFSQVTHLSELLAQYSKKVSELYRLAFSYTSKQGGKS